MTTSKYYFSKNKKPLQHIAFIGRTLTLLY